MILTILSYAMIIVFMFVIMKKKMSPFTALVIIPLCFTIIAMLAGVADKGNIGDFVLEGVATTANTGIMLLFAILYFSIMLDAGLFDPITRKMIYFAKEINESPSGDCSRCSSSITKRGWNDNYIDLLLCVHPNL